MNSFIQALYTIKEFRERVLKIKYNYNQEGSDRQKMDIEGEIPFQKQPTSFKEKVQVNEAGVRLQKLFAVLYQSARPSINPSFFREIIPDFFRMNFQQQDASEFGRIYLDSFERTLKMASDKVGENNTSSSS